MLVAVHPHEQDTAMELGLSTYSYHLAFGKHPDRRADGPMTLIKCLKRVKELGFAAVQIDPAHVNPEKDNAKWLKSMADSLGLALEPSSVGIEGETLARDLALAADWHAPVLRTILSWERPRLGRHPEAKLTEAAERLRTVLPEAERRGVTIAVENHGDVSTPDLLLLLAMVDSPRVGICLDVANSMVFLEDPVWTAQQLAPHAVTGHLKDYRWWMTNSGAKLSGVPLGEGNVDLDAVLATLVKAPRLNRVMLECSTEATGSDSEMLAAEDRAVMKSVEYWRRWVREHPQ